MVRIAICGACGQMGQRITKSVNAQEDMEIVAAIDRPNVPEAGQDLGKVAGIGNIDVEVVGAEKIEETLESADPDVLVDFTTAESAVNNVKAAAKKGVSVVVGTTGFTDEQREEMKTAIEENEIGAIISSNMSVGVNLFFKLVEIAAEKLEDYDMELVEAHHNKKVDAPSGTAMTTAKIAAKASGKDFEKSAKFGRPKGEIGERTKEEIGIHSIRGGDIAGDHTFMLAGPSERLELTHRAQSRQAFVTGVLKAIRHIVKNKEPGKVQNMQDILFGESE